MKLLTRNRWAGHALVLCLGLGLVACAGHKTDPTACLLSDSSNVDRLFDEVQSKLDDSSCHYHWSQYQERLLTAAKGSPGPENEARFADLLRTAIERGIIGKRQGQQLFSRYFDPEFYVVKAEPRSSCSALRQKDSILSDMRSELAYKREGMLEVLGDEPRFRLAQQHYSDLRLVFDAVDVACGES